MKQREQEYSHYTKGKLLPWAQENVLDRFFQSLEHLAESLGYPTFRVTPKSLGSVFVFVFVFRHP